MYIFKKLTFNLDVILVIFLKRLLHKTFRKGIVNLKFTVHTLLLLNLQPKSRSKRFFLICLKKVFEIVIHLVKHSFRTKDPIHFYKDLYELKLLKIYRQKLFILLSLIEHNVEKFSCERKQNQNLCRIIFYSN